MAGVEGVAHKTGCHGLVVEVDARRQERDTSHDGSNDNALGSSGWVYWHNSFPFVC